MISCNGRFTDCDDSSFPAVYNYNYVDNLGTRAINNRSFRWEDVAKRSIYLYREATISGTLENNSYLSLHTVTNFTGVNYITGVDSTSYPGWTISGNNVLWVGMSGVQISSGQLTGFTGSASLFPLQGNESIAIYNYTGRPTVVGHIPGTGTSTGIIPSNTHQVYVLAKTAYNPSSSGEYLHAYPRGWNSNSIVAYYNYVTNTWDLTAPSTGFFVSKNGYTEIKYTFATTDYPAATPTGFDLYVSPVTTGRSIIVVDEMHIDAVLKKNAFVDYVVPSGYVIEITPDLGWHNTLEMFSTNGDSNNPFLKTLGPFSINAGTLSDNLDNTVTATVDESDFDTAINNRYSRYLWRAIALSQDGSYGDGGIPQRFSYVGQDIESSFSVDTVSSLPDEVTKTIVGKKSSRSSILVNDVTGHNGLTYATPNDWKLVYILDTPSTTLKLQALDEGGATSSVKYVQLTNTLFEQSHQALWNVFDEHGLIMDLNRLPGESNSDFSERIKDVPISVGGSTFQGVVNGATRELGLNKITDAISISIKKDTSNLPYTTELMIDVGAAYVLIRCPSMIMEETLLVDPVYRTITLSKVCNEFPSYCEVTDGRPVKLSSMSWDKSNEIDDSNRIIIDDPYVLGKHVTVRYEYYEKVPFVLHQDIGAVVDAINSIRDNTGNYFVTASMSIQLSGNEKSLGLFDERIVITPSDSASLSWSPVFLKRVSDKSFREYYHDAINYKRSTFYKYVQQLKLNSRVLWGSVEADRDYWDSAERTDLSFDEVPTIMDPDMSEFYSTLTGNQIKFDGVQAWGRGYVGFSGESLINAGVNSSNYQPGVGFSSSLTPAIYTTSSYKFGSSDEYYGVSDTKENNDQVIFSGQT